MLLRRSCTGLPDCSCMAAAKKRCEAGCWRQGAAKLLSERTKAFVHTISERKKSGKIAPLPPLVVSQPIALLAPSSSDIDMITGAAPLVCLSGTGSHVLQPVCSSCPRNRALSPSWPLTELSAMRA